MFKYSKYIIYDIHKIVYIYIHKYGCCYYSIMDRHTIQKLEILCTCHMMLFSYYMLLCVYIYIDVEIPNFIL